jgi:uncharacterized membrane protein SirB2
MIDVVTLKQFHILLAFTSIIFFFIRFMIKEKNSAIIKKYFFKTAPHLIDTLLLSTGVALAWAYKVSPLDAKWFLIKIVFIIFYIICGFIAMKASSRKLRFLSATTGLLFIFSAMYLAHYKPFW